MVADNPHLTLPSRIAFDPGKYANHPALEVKIDALKQIEKAFSENPNTKIECPGCLARDWEEHQPNCESMRVPVKEYTIRNDRSRYVKNPAFEVKNPNPKDSIGSSKIPVHLWPETATVLGALGLLDGAGKYGRGNYRASPVRATIYYDALKRHVNGWFSGRPCDPDSGLPDLAHALACLAIIVDAEAAGTLVDDRDFNSGYAALIERMTPFVKQLQDKHAGKSPKHYTIADNK